MQEMRSLFATGTVIGKFALLGCFSLFGGHCGIVSAVEVSPCHQVVTMEQASEVDTAEPCGQCETSVETWAEPIAAPFIEEKDVPDSFIFFAEEQEGVHIDEIAFEPVKQPPGDLETRAFQRIVQSTKWQDTDH